MSVRERSKSLSAITSSLSTERNSMDWLEWHPDNFSGKITSAPLRDQIPENIKEQLIVELYSK